MSRLENPSLGQRLTICIDKKEQEKFFGAIKQQIINGGLPTWNLSEVSEIAIHGWTVRKIIDQNISEGVLRINDGIIILNQAQNPNDNDERK